VVAGRPTAGRSASVRTDRIDTMALRVDTAGVSPTRIAAEARGSEILVSSLVRELTESAGEFTFGGPTDAELKGLSGMYRLSTVRWQE
jgi:hypothetical protein